MSQPVRQMLRPILHLRLDATAWKRGPPIIIVSIAATVPTQAAPMTVSLAFFIRVGIGCKSFTCAVDDCGDDNDRHEVPWIGLGANTTTNASRKADKAYTNMVRTVDYCLARRMQTPDMPGAPSLGMATIARGGRGWPRRLADVTSMGDGACSCGTPTGTCVTSPLTFISRE